VQDRVQQTQREYYLREQMKVFRRKLGEQDEGQRDVEDLKKKNRRSGIARRGKRKRSKS